ncbi:hypothetical protein [Puniceicoccus vermicola]|uniref:Uncharacterized protein n=1 Tax=Puniceicoccus vermicola TaxID=388746 RepID=A0A7X1AXD1_9BACT|nr:hypothetical protein [Puniceicoccus vermicola]MBC2601649.1 hypothetical protein [Puniceicoccus vermicola]
MRREASGKATKERAVAEGHGGNITATRRSHRIEDNGARPSREQPPLPGRPTSAGDSHKTIFMSSPAPSEGARDWQEGIRRDWI